jgi:DNA polymerase-1
MAQEPILVANMEMAGGVLNRLRDPQTKTWVYDAETTGLSWKTDRIVGHVMTFGPAPSDTYYVPVRHGENYLSGNILEHPDKLHHPFEQELNKILSTRRDLHTVGHHLMFDLMFAHSHGIDFIGTMEDTEVNDALIDELASSHSLESACKRAGTEAKLGKELYVYLANKYGGPPERRSQMGNFWKLEGHDPVGFDYAAGDGVATWGLYEKQLEVLNREFDEEKNTLNDMRMLESKVTRTIYRMTRRGVRIDISRLNEVIQIVEDKLAGAQKVLPPGLNINSQAQIRKILEAEGIGGWPMTAPTPRFPQGNPSFTEAYLKTIPLGKEILVVRKYLNLLNSFALPMRDQHTYLGRIHSTFTQMANDEFGTITGRFSSSQPNLQQVPKRNKELAELIRSCFIPDDGLDWIDADLSQCEPRLLAHYSNARVLVEGYLASPSVDAHSAVAQAANIDREDGKRLNQTLITGGGKNKIIAMLGAEGASIYDKYFEAMPEIRRLQKNASLTLQQRGYIRSLKGRLARLENSSKAYLAINRLLQCGNADIVKEAMVRIDELFEANGDVVMMLNTVHDALAFQGDMADPHHMSLIQEALRIMTDYGPEDSGRSTYLRVPMVADYGVGKNWAEATYPKVKMTFGDN